VVLGFDVVIIQVINRQVIPLSNNKSKFILFNTTYVIQIKREKTNHQNYLSTQVDHDERTQLRSMSNKRSFQAWLIRQLVNGISDIV
jgi:hypothetical protein